MNYGRGYLLVFTFCAVARSADGQVTRGDTPVPVARLVSIAPAIQLEVVDWGGHGRPLVFLAGSANTAHMFDEFAPQFTDRFHVLGITRRGYGPSSAVLPANDPDTLVSDLRSTLDSLGFARVILVGHSFAGEEMTRFAELNPSRCAGLIYIDAAYDRTAIPSILQATPPPPPPAMRTADSASADALRAYIERVSGVAVPKSEILATSRFDASGRLLGSITPDSLEGRLLEASRTPRYDRVQCRSLGIYAGYDSAADLFPYYAELDSAGRRQADAAFKPFKELAAKSETLFRQSGRNEVVEVRHSKHYVFVQRPTEVARAMRRFLTPARN